MEPGHEDREYLRNFVVYGDGAVLPQWSPVMKTGNTCWTATTLRLSSGRLNGARS